MQDKKVIVHSSRTRLLMGLKVSFLPNFNENKFTPTSVGYCPGRFKTIVLSSCSLILIAI